MTSEKEHLEGTVVVGPLGTIEDVDEAACALLGYSKDELVGLHGSELIPYQHRPAVAVVLDRLRQGDATSARLGLVMRKGGSVLRVEVTARRLPINRLALMLRPQRAGS